MSGELYVLKMRSELRLVLSVDDKGVVTTLAYDGSLGHWHKKLFRVEFIRGFLENGTWVEVSP